MVEVNGGKHKVAIVGAGFAGLAAARRLCQRPEQFQVHLLEAAGRLGGRVRSVTLSQGVRAELGATYLYDVDQGADGTEGCALGKLARESGCVAGRLCGYSELEASEVPSARLLSSGEEVDLQLVKRCREVYSSAKEELNRWAEEGREFDESPEGVRNYEQYLSRCFSSSAEAKGLHSFAPIFLGFMKKFEDFENGTKTADKVGVAQYNFADFVYQLVLKSDYQAIVDAMVKDIPPACISLQTEVTSINWTPSSHGCSADVPAVTVMCRGGQAYHVDHVIVTSSLGVLQHRCLGSSDLFTPSLPASKLSAMQALAMGMGETLLLEFHQPLLNTPHRAIELYWQEQQEEEEEDILQRHPWARSVYILHRVQDSSVYGTWLTEGDALAMVELPESEVAEVLCAVIGRFLQRTIERPPRVHRSSWCTDPFVRGSYSYYSWGSSRRDREELGRPVDGSTHLQLLFAGEATHPSMFSTTNGAFDSGEREADRLIQLYCGKL